MPSPAPTRPDDLEAGILTRRTLTAAIAAVAALVAAIALISPASALTTPRAERTVTRSQQVAARLQNADYVALGDSYAAGYGLGALTDQPVPACAQSKNDYPHLVAKKLHMRLTDVTCAGATSDNVVSASQSGAPPQVDALSGSTRVVTLTIGGNDAGLFATASSCLALTPTGPVFSGRDAPSCKSRLVRDGHDELRDEVDGPVRDGIRQAIQAVQAKAPNARIIVVGYPAVFPNQRETPKKGCFRSALDFGSLSGAFPRNAFPFTNTDTKYLAGVQQELDRVTRQVAATAGVTYVSLLSGTESRSACNPSKALVEGVTLTATSNFDKIDLAVGALHPNKQGATYMAGRAEKAILADFS